MTVNRKAVARKTTGSKVSRLSEGDTVEYSVSAAIRIPRQGEAWIKVGATTKLAAGETDAEASRRLAQYVHDTMDEAVKGILE